MSRSSLSRYIGNGPPSRGNRNDAKTVTRLSRRTGFDNAQTKARGNRAKRGRSGRGPTSPFPTGPSGSMQRSAVRVQYTGNKGPGQWRAHGDYVEREGAQQDGKKGVGFSAESDEAAIGATLDEWQQDGVERLWKVVISPEFGEAVDLQAHTREVMDRMSRDLATDLDWVAIDHYNTDNPHVHVLLRGQDDRGQALDINPAYIRFGMRQRSEEDLTMRLGYRTQSHEREARQREVVQTRYTALDREIEKNLDRDRSISEPPLTPGEDGHAERNERVRRLGQLEEMGLATRTGPYDWHVDDSLQPALEQMRTAKDRQRSLDQHRQFLSDERLPLRHTKMRDGERVTGVLLGTGMDENAEKPYALIEGVDGRVHYLHQSDGFQQARKDGQARIGEVVAIERHRYTDNQGNNRVADTVTDHGPPNAASQDRALLEAERKYAERLHGSDKTMGRYIADNTGSFPGQFAQAMRGHIERSQPQQQRRQTGRSADQGQDQSR